MNQTTRRLKCSIEKQITTISTTFEIFLEIFGSEENTIAIQNTSPVVFGTIHNSLIESVVIGLNRLCDPAGTGKRTNLTIERLRLSLPSKSTRNQELVKKLELIEKEIKIQIKTLNIYRNKRLAHNDYQTIARRRYRSIDNGSIDKALVLLEGYTNEINLHFDNCNHSLLKPFFSLKDGPERLMWTIRLGVEERERVKQRKLDERAEMVRSQGL